MTNVILNEYDDDGRDLRWRLQTAKVLQRTLKEAANPLLTYLISSILWRNCGPGSVYVQWGSFVVFSSCVFILRTFELVNMYRVYLGNLDEQVTEPILQKVFADHSLPVTSILIKRGYGFVDCPDQTTFDQTIDRLNG